jgi:hypothetical protein
MGALARRDTGWREGQLRVAKYQSKPFVFHTSSQIHQAARSIRARRMTGRCMALPPRVQASRSYRLAGASFSRGIKG